MREPSELAQYQSDHDLLVELRTEFRGMRKDIQDLTDGTALTLAEHTKQIDRLEFWRGVSQGIGIVVLAILPLVFWLYSSFYALSSSLDARISRNVNTALTNYGLINR